MVNDYDEKQCQPARTHMVPEAITRLETSLESLGKSIELIRQAFGPAVILNVRDEKTAASRSACPAPIAGSDGSALGHTLISLVTRLEHYTADIVEIANASDL